VSRFLTQSPMGVNKAIWGSGMAISKLVKNVRRQQIISRNIPHAVNAHGSVPASREEMFTFS
jgi:hypothetical protein